MATYRLKRKTFGFNPSTLAGKNIGFFGGLFGGKNFQNISKMKAINKSLTDAGKTAKFGTGAMIGEATKGVLKAAGTTTLAAGGLAAGGMALNDAVTKTDDN